MRRRRDTHPVPQRRCCPECNAIFRARLERCPTDGAELEPLPRDPMLGERVGLAGYAIEEVVADTPFGRLYRASAGSAAFALLVMYGDVAALPRHADRFARHARRTRGLDRPELIVPIDAGTTAAGLPFLASRWVEGRCLLELIQQEAPLDADRAAALARDVAEALGPLHARGLVHGDLTPERIVVVEAARERATVDFARPGVALGAVPYRAPERAASEHPDGRGDLYSLGVILYEMLAGVPPYGGSALQQAIDGAQGPPPPIASRAPGVHPDARAEAIALQLLQPDPAERFESAGAVAAALATVGSHDVS